MLSIIAALLLAAPPAVAPPSTFGPGAPIKARVGSVTTTHKTATWTYRQPQGHTHTCSKCGKSWDHAANPTHACAFCGTMQFVQDRTPRLVAVKTMAASSTSTTPQTFRVIQQSGCANGNCPIAR